MKKNLSRFVLGVRFDCEPGLVSIALYAIEHFSFASDFALRRMSLLDLRAYLFKCLELFHSSSRFLRLNDVNVNLYLDSIDSAINRKSR